LGPRYSHRHPAEHWAEVIVKQLSTGQPRFVAKSLTSHALAERDSVTLDIITQMQSLGLSKPA